MLRLVTSSLFLILCSSPARADLPAAPIDEPGMTLPLGQTEGLLIGNTEPSHSPAVAVMLSLGTTAGTIGIGALMAETCPACAVATIALGASFGPSIGHFYAGEPGHALLTGGLRLGLGVGGSLLAIGGALSGLGCSGDCDDGDGMIFGGLAMLGGAAALAIYDFIDAGFAARRASRRSVSLTPVLGQSQGRTLYGVGLTGNF